MKSHLHVELNSCFSSNVSEDLSNSIGFKPKFLSNRTNPKSKKGSTLQVKTFSVQIFLITYAMAPYKPAGGSLKLFDSSIRPQPLESILDGPDPLPYFRAVFHTSSVLIESSCM